MDFIRIRIIYVKHVMLNVKHAPARELQHVLVVIRMLKNVCLIPRQINVYAQMDTMMILLTPVKYVI